MFFSVLNQMLKLAVFCNVKFSSFDKVNSQVIIYVLNHN